MTKYGKAVTAEATLLLKLFTGVTSTTVKTQALKSLLLTWYLMWNVHISTELKAKGKITVKGKAIKGKAPRSISGKT